MVSFTDQGTFHGVDRQAPEILEYVFKHMGPFDTSKQ